MELGSVYSEIGHFSNENFQAPRFKRKRGRYSFEMMQYRGSQKLSLVKMSKKTD